MWWTLHYIPSTIRWIMWSNTHPYGLTHLYWGWGGSFATFSIFKSIFTDKMTAVYQVLVRMQGNWNSQGMRCKMVEPHWKTVWQLLKKFNIHLPHDPATPLLGVYPREMKSRVHTEPWPRMFRAALLTWAKKWNQPKCLSTDEWIHTPVHPCSGTVLSDKKEWAADTHYATDESQVITQSERNQMKKSVWCPIPFT